MFFSQENFDNAVATSGFLRQRLKTREKRIVAEGVLDAADKTPFQTKDYCEALFLAFLMRGTRIAKHRGGSKKITPPNNVVRAVFDICPFVLIDKESGVYRINESEALAPIKLRDMIEETLLIQCSFISIKFGCVEVEYEIKQTRIDVALELKESNLLEAARDELRLAQLYVDNNKLI